MSIVTVSNAPSNERALNTLKKWVMTNDPVFLGGVDKGLVLGVLNRISSLMIKLVYKLYKGSSFISAYTLGVKNAKKLIINKFDFYSQN